MATPMLATKLYIPPPRRDAVARPRLVARCVYLLLMDDRYPALDEQQAVRLDIPYPDTPRELNRWLPLVKRLLALPHYILLVFLYIATAAVVIAAWFAILFTGRYPRSLYSFVEGVIRWQNRVAGCAFLLVTDRYPPFSLEPLCACGRRRSGFSLTRIHA